MVGHQRHSRDKTDRRNAFGYENLIEGSQGQLVLITGAGLVINSKQNKGFEVWGDILSCRGNFFNFKSSGSLKNIK